MKTSSPNASFLFSAIAGAVCLVLSQTVFSHSKGEWKNMAQIYASTCHYCHDTGVGPILLGRQLPASYVAHRVRNGFNAMPSFKPSEIGVSDLESLAQWISLSAQPNKPSVK